MKGLLSIICNSSLLAPSALALMKVVMWVMLRDGLRPSRSITHITTFIGFTGKCLQVKNDAPMGGLNG
jgi:hypothetical protein